MIEVWDQGRKDQPWQWFGIDNGIGNWFTDITPAVVSTENVHYAIEIDISDNTDIADEKEIGLFQDSDLTGQPGGGSAFRWITERPDYDGSIVVPTGELPTVNATKWAEGMIASSENLGSPIRLINVNIAGNYGSLSGFTFSLDNVRIEGGNFSGQIFFDILDDNKFFMLNRKIRFYIVLDNVFFNVWSGIVAKVSHDETKFNIICEDDFRNLHKTIPPQIANETLFPNIIKKFVGKPIPVTLGIVNHAKLINIQTMNESIITATEVASGFDVRVSPIVAAVPITDSAGNQTGVLMNILNGDKSFANNELKGKFLRIILDGGSQNFFEIISSSTTSLSSEFGQNLMGIVISGNLDVTNLIFYTFDDIPSNIERKSSWIDIFDFQSTYLISNDPIFDFPDSDTGQTVTLSFYDKDQEDFIDVSEAGELESLTNINNIRFPGIIAFTNAISNDGNFLKTVFYKPKKVLFTGLFPDDFEGTIVSSDTFPTKNTDALNLIDRDYSTTYQVVFQRTSPGSITRSNSLITFRVWLPDEMKGQEFTKIFIAIDYDQKMELTTTNDLSRGSLSLIPVSVNGQFGGAIFRPKFSNGKFTSDVPLVFRMIPPSYYGDVGERDPLIASINDVLNLQSFYISNDEFKAFSNLLFTVFISNQVLVSTTEDMTIDFHQIAIGGVKTITVVNDNIFVKVNGEKTVSGNDRTDNVFQIFLKILEDYDDLTVTTDFDVGDISSRKEWVAGRQLTERKSSFTYFKELAMQSFVGIFPSRTGLRKFRAFREFSTSTVTFSNDNGNIIADSITRFELSPINEIFNEFDIKYEYIEAGKRFDKSIFIKRVIESDFPNRFDSTDAANDTTDSNTDFSITNLSGLTATGVFTFGATPGAFVVGKTISFDDSAGIGIFEFGTIIDTTATTVTVNFKNLAGFILDQSTATGTIHIQGSSVPEWTTFAGGFVEYSRGSQLWTVCRHSFLETLVVRELPSEYSDCRFYVDEDAFNGGNIGQGATPFKYLELLVEWTTLQKEITEFAIPLTTANVVRELLDFVKFRDQKYTAGELREGYITKIKPEPARDQIIIELTLIPSNIESITDCLIVESGTRDDTIVESGAEADTIVETGTC